MSTNNESFYALSALTPGGKTVSFETFRGKTVLVVNTATKCGLAPQFDGLEKLHQKYKDRGLAVVGFPCDQFAHQEPVDNADMEQVCKVNFGVTFPLMAKVEVNGPGTHPVFQFLKKNDPGFLNEELKWNFTKFLVSPDGTSVRRFAPTTEPARIEKDIERLLAPGS